MIQVGFIVHLMSGEARKFSPRVRSLTPLRDNLTPNTISVVKMPILRTEHRVRKKIKIACFTHNLGYGVAALFAGALASVRGPLGS
jgi:hypothetical protein